MSCSCESFIKNVGLAKCKQGEQLPFKVYIQAIRDKNGVRNGIDVGDLPTPTDYFDDLVNEPDPFKRLFPINEEMFEVTRGENEADTEDVDGVSFKLRDGNKTVVWAYKNVPIKMNAILKSLECSEFGIYFLMRSGDLQGELSKDKETLYPMKIDNRTFTSVFSQTFTTTSTINVNAMFDRLLRDQDIATLSADAFTEDIRDLKGLVDIFPKLVGVPTNTTLVIDFKSQWGNLDRLEGMEGKVEADFVITEGGAAVTKTVVESTDVKGRYTFTLTGVTAGDVLVISLASGVKYYEMNPFTVIIPN
jgi:hypothetical protein